MTAILVAYRKTARRYSAALDRVCNVLASKHSAFDKIIADSPEGLKGWIANLASANVIYSAGGDGLLRDLVNLLAYPAISQVAVLNCDDSTELAAQRTEESGSGGPVTFGIIPMGTGNEVARALRLPLDPVRAAHIFSGACHTISALAGRVTLLEGMRAPADASGIYRNRAVILFINSVGTGIDSATVQARNAFARLRLNHYLITFLLGVLPRLKPFQVRVYRNKNELIYDGDSVWTIALRGSCIGGGIALNPAADFSNPEINLIIVKGASRLQIFREISRALAGRALESPHVVRFKGASLLLEFGEPRAISLDGDILMTAQRLIVERGPEMRLLVPDSFH